jgi:hypothetical protein
MKKKAEKIKLDKDNLDSVKGGAVDEIKSLFNVTNFFS